MENTKSSEAYQTQKNHHFEGLMFAGMAGSAAIVMGMLLLLRASLFSFLHQWRFLAINLLFLAIVISLSQNPSRKVKPFCQTTAADSEFSEYQYSEKMGVEESVEEGVGNGGGDGYGEMSKEELNRRAEAFIASFRKQLVSDIAKNAHSKVGFAN